MTVLRLAAAALASALAAGTLVLAPTAASASSDQVWTGGGDGTSWSDGQNWQSMSVPQNGDSVTIPAVNFPARTVVTGMPSGTQLQDLTLTDASLSGGDATVAGDFSWSVSQGFEILGSPLTVAGNASFSGAGERDSQAPMTFDGNTDIAGPGLLSIQDTGPAITNSGTLTLEPGAVVRASVCCVTPDEFINNGTVAVPASGTATVAFMGFHDQGSVSVGPGGLLDIGGGPGVFGAGAGLGGGGTLQFDQGAAITLAPHVSIAAGSTMLLTGNAQFLGAGSFTGGGKFSWTGGTIDGNLGVASTIHTTISGKAIKTFTSPTSKPMALTLRGGTTLRGPGEVELSGATTLSNLGTLTMGPGTTVGASVCCVHPDHFSNGGTLIVAAGTKTATATNLAFSNSGTVKITGGTLFVNTLSYKQAAGATQLAGGALSAAQPIDIAGGTLSGFGTITGSVQNAGRVSPSTTGGVLKITGAYQQTKTGVLTSVLTGTSPGTKFGQLSVGGKATLDGTLKVSPGNGFNPHGKSFSVLLYKSRSGKFATLSGSPAYTVSYGPAAAKAVYP